MKERKTRSIVVPFSLGTIFSTDLPIKTSAEKKENTKFPLSVSQDAFRHPRCCCSCSWSCKFRVEIADFAAG